MRDFSPEAYRHLIEAISRRYRVVTVRECCTDPSLRGIAALRHDVDRRPLRATCCARIAAEMGVRGTFYFRYPKTFRREIVEEVAQRGHEVGYHYEVLTKARGDIEGALRLFRQELEVFREVVDVTSACMHGAPLSRWHNLDIWKSANPIDFGLVGEAYLSIDWDATFYLTDTGRGWNLSRAAVRDVAGGRSRLSFPSTRALADALTAGELPDRIAVTIHPERWVDSAVVATWDTLVQRCKNLVKGVVVDRLPVARE